MVEYSASSKWGRIGQNIKLIIIGVVVGAIIMAFETLPLSTVSLIPQFKTRVSFQQDLFPDGSSPGKPHVQCVVVFTSKAESMERRMWVRRQFQRSLDLLRAQNSSLAAGVVMKFILGTRGMSSTVLSQLLVEEERYGDILLEEVLDFDDPDPPLPTSDSATSLKVVRSMIWAMRHYEFDYFIRIGDDAYLRIDHFLINVIPTLPRERLLLGYCEKKRMYYVFKSHSNDIADISLPYCSGMGFVLTYDAVAFAARNADMLALEYPEDAMVARWFMGTKVEIVHDPRFVDWDWNKCNNETILVHKHNYERVPEDGIMTSCFSKEQRI